MADINQLPVMTARDAESIGFARFNDVPTLPNDIPDGNFTISARTSDGRRITFFFGECERGAPPSNSEEHTYELQSLTRVSFVVFILIKKKKLHREKVHTHNLRDQHNINY